MRRGLVLLLQGAGEEGNCSGADYQEINLFHAQGDSHEALKQMCNVFLP